jgi:hypothetical protein
MTPDAAIQGRLATDESLQWTAQPSPAHAMWAGLPGSTWSVRMGCFALLAVLAALFSLGGLYLLRLAAGAFVAVDDLALVLGAPMLLAVALVFAVAPWVLLARPRLRHRDSARSTWYAITDRRILVLLIRDGAIMNEQATALEEVVQVTVRLEREDGVGDVIYATADAREPGGAAAGGLIAVPEARLVAHRIRRATGMASDDVIAA